MSSGWSSWIRIFDILDIKKHKNGFTMYKTTSILYPKSCPEAITQMTVWKRFNDFKLLHKEMKYLLREMKIQDELPSLPKSSLFKRFDEETINNRKSAILKLLEYIGSHSPLFTSIVFVKFFETSHTPTKLINGKINSIRAKLNLPDEIDNFPNSDDEKLSDTDSLISFEFLIPVKKYDIDEQSISQMQYNTNLKKLNSVTSIDSQSSKTSENITIVENNLSLFEEPLSKTVTDDKGQYLIDAAIHVNIALELEIDKKYEEAFTAYKAAIDILIRGRKDDPKYDRREIAKYKTDKYLIRAEKIFNMHLTDEIKSLRLNKQVENIDTQSTKKGSLVNLYKYKVIKIIYPSGMLVIHSDSQQLYYAKVIYKSMNFRDDNLILPENIPYMVKLYDHYNFDNAVFLILEYCSCKKMIDFIKSEYLNSIKNNPSNTQGIERSSDNEFEQKFSELINEYTIITHNKIIVENVRDKTDDDSNYVVFKTIRNSKTFDSYEDVNQTEGAISLIEPCIKSITYQKKVVIEEDDYYDNSDEFDSRMHVPEKLVIKWTSQLLLALEKLHLLGVICRDLSINNLLLDENNNILLTYKCNIIEINELAMNELKTNLAPELYGFEEITNAVDWWSFGIILYELLVGIPFNKIHPNIMISNININIPKYVSPEGQSLLRQMLIYEPNDRLGAGPNGIQNIKSHPFFKTIIWND